MAIDNEGLRSIGAAAQALRNYQGLAKLHGRTPIEERRMRKATLIREIAAGWFGPEALSHDEITKLLVRSPRLFHASLDDDLVDDHPLYGCARSITGVWPLTREAFVAFIENAELDWDDLGDDCFDLERSGPANDRWIGINVIVSVPFIAGLSNEMGLGSALAALGKHIRGWTGPIDLNDAQTAGHLPRLVTTVEYGSKTWEFAEAVGMWQGSTTSHNWTKYWLDLNDLGHLSPEALRRLNVLIHLVNTAESQKLY